MLAHMKTEMPTQNVSNPPLIPKGRIGRFVFEQEIGHGSVGIVYLFRDPMIGRKVAIKVLNPQMPANQRQLFEKQFIQEARAAGRLNHPNIVTVYDADKSGELLFIVMEFLEGKELRDMLASGHQFSYKQIADMIGRIANALDYAHEHGVIHRDIKPTNIFVTDSGAPKVLDFGIASASRQMSDADATIGNGEVEERRLMGTPNYMSPEQTKSETVDARSDIFSLGVVLYQMLCGQLPFRAPDIPGLLHAIAHDAPIPPQEIKADVPLRLARIAGKALAKKPADRYQHASEMARDLNRYLEKERTERLMAKIQNPALQNVADSTLNEALKSKNRSLMQRLNLPPWALVAALGASLVLIVVLWMTVQSNSHRSATTPALAEAATPASTPAVALPLNASDTLAASTPSAQTTPTGSEAKQDESSKPNAEQLDALAKQAAADAKAEKAKAAKAAKLKAAATPIKVEAAPVSTGSVAIAVSPWGEVYVDGQAKGVAPPLTRLTLPVGKHKVEIRNGDESYVANVEVSTEKEAKISHRF